MLPHVSLFLYGVLCNHYIDSFSHFGGKKKKKEALIVQRGATKYCFQEHTFWERVRNSFKTTESQQHFLGYLASLSGLYLSIWACSYQLLMLHFLKQSIKAQKRWSGRTLGMKQELTAAKELSSVSCPEETLTRYQRHLVSLNSSIS